MKTAEFMSIENSNSLGSLTTSKFQYFYEGAEIYSSWLEFKFPRIKGPPSDFNINLLQENKRSFLGFGITQIISVPTRSFKTTTIFIYHVNKVVPHSSHICIYLKLYLVTPCPRELKH